MGTILRTTLAFFLFLILPNPSHASGKSSAKDYVHIKLAPEFIQDLPNLKPGSPPPTPVEIATSEYKVELDLYFSADTPNSPAFIVGSFNAQRENRQWITIIVEHRITTLMSSDKFNKIEAASIARLSRSDQLFQPSFTPFSPDQIVFTALNDQPEMGKIQPYLNLMAALPDKQYLIPEEPFPFELYLRYGLPNPRNRKLAIHYKKFITGSASIVQLDMLDIQTIEELLRNAGCENQLGHTLH